jgi:hypothetical protein
VGRGSWPGLASPGYNTRRRTQERLEARGKRQKARGKERESKQQAAQAQSELNHIEAAVRLKLGVDLGAVQKRAQVGL